MQQFAKDIELIKRLFDYNPKTGVVIWRKRDDVPKWWNTRYAGNRPKSTDSLGYLRAKITANGASAYVSLHRICFFMAHGFLPEVVDHVNGDVQDNRISNLRAADFKTNAWNRAANKNTLTGKKGVSAIRYSKGPKKGQISGYKASVGHNGERIYLGYFNTEQDAADAVARKEIELRNDWRR